MSTIVVPDEYAQEFRQAKEETELRDRHGNLVGRFIPSRPELPLHHGLTDEEFASRLSPDAKTYTTAEVIAYLKGLPT